MKKLPLLLLALSGLQHLQAQVNTSTNAHHRQLSHMLQHNAQNLKKQALRSGTQRVIGQSTMDTGENYTDSSKLWYNSIGASAYDYNTMVYAYNYPYSTSPLFNNFQGIYTSPQVEFRRHDRWTINPNTLMYGFYQRDLAGYDAFQRLVQDTIVYADSAVQPNMVYTNTFNASGNITKARWCNWSGGVCDSAFKQYFQYDGSGLLVKDSLYEWGSGSWHLVAKSFYTYDINGNPVLIKHYSNQTDPTFTAPLIERLRYENTYDTDNRLLTVNTLYHDGTSLAPYVRDTFEYTGSLGFHTAWREHQYDAINFTWTPQHNMVKHLDAADKPDTVNIYSFDLLLMQWVPFSRYVASYNTQGNPVRLEEYIYDFTAFPVNPDYVTRYYYEDYMIPTAQQELPEHETAIDVYPNPVSDVLYVRSGAAASGSVSITDVQGRCLYRAAAGGNLQSIGVNWLPSGIYVLGLQDENGTRTIRFVKQ